MHEISLNFFKTAIEVSALKFGEFTLKSGRQSPYFFNAGLFNNGKSLYHLAQCYAQRIMESKVKFDVLFGPAYKGIPLAAIVSSVLYKEYGKNIGYCYNRKEAKLHGEGGVLVGDIIKGKKVLIIDDVITAGTAINEAINLIEANKGIIAGVCVALDRQEIAPNETVSAIQILEKNHDFSVHAVATLEQLIDYLQTKNKIELVLISNMRNYIRQYGAKTA